MGYICAPTDSPLGLWGRRPELTHELITRGQGQCDQGAYIEDRSIYVLDVETPAYPSYLGGVSIHVCTLLYTHVYTVIYTRVHYLALSISPLALSRM